jgi:hypothetical protein
MVFENRTLGSLLGCNTSSSFFTLHLPQPTCYGVRTAHCHTDKAQRRKGISVGLLPVLIPTLVFPRWSSSIPIIKTVFQFHIDILSGINLCHPIPRLRTTRELSWRVTTRTYIQAPWLKNGDEMHNSLFAISASHYLSNLLKYSIGSLVTLWPCEGRYSAPLPSPASRTEGPPSENYTQVKTLYKQQTSHM